MTPMVRCGAQSTSSFTKGLHRPGADKPLLKILNLNWTEPKEPQAPIIAYMTQPGLVIIGLPQAGLKLKLKISSDFSWPHPLETST